ncbi:MAG TPA: SurA N-terminal domain-containing protein [Chitinophagaceae bacterium]|nr:SurA N-terminal domain-containing protein [Chitinophagaceae bacterium]
MSIIQRIRDRAAWLIFGAIALAMIGFIVTDAFQGGGGGWFNSQPTTIGKVNGKKIEYALFQKRLEAIEQNSPGMDDRTRESVQNDLWNQMVDQALLKGLFDDLGLYITDKEVSYMLYDNPHPQLRQQLTNPETGQFDVNDAYQRVENFKKQRPQQYQEFIEGVVYMRQREKYLSLLTNTVYIPKWMAEKSNADASQLANVSYVLVPYSSIADSTVKVSDEDVKAFMDKHPEQFKQEESRDIAYVAFDAGASPKDTAAIRQTLLNVKHEFDTTTDHVAFLAKNGSETNFSNNFVTDYQLQVPFKDSITALPEGAVFGPYEDAGTLVLAKMIEKRTMPDSVKVRHILISNQTRPDSTAKTRIDSVQRVLEAGSDFKTVATTVSEDPSVKENGGEYWLHSLTYSNWEPAFAEAGFFGKKGDKKIVKTSYGYHYMEILDPIKIGPAYKVAYLRKGVVPSTETTNAASGLASQFSGQSRNAKAFDENVAKFKLNKILSSDITPAAIGIPNLGYSRQLVRWIYDAELGDVSEPIVVDERYIVAIVTGINKEGTMSVQKARPMVEVLIRNEKKAAQLSQRIGKPANLQAVSAATGQPVQRADSISFGAAFIPSVGQELKVIGAAFNRAWLNKVSEPIAGNGGVYVIQTESIFARPNPGADIEQQRTLAADNIRRRLAELVFIALRDAADITDNRRKFL